MAARNPFASSIPDIYDPYAAPVSRRAPLSTGYYFIRNLLVVGGVCGGLVALYRNDVFRDLARRVGQEPRYLAAEQYLVGTPGWGTPRSMEPVLQLNGAEPASTADGTAIVGAAPVVTATANEPSTAAVTAAVPEPASRDAQPSPAVAEPPAPLPAAPVAVTAAVQAQPAAAPPTPVDPLAPVSFDSLPVVNKTGAATPAVAFAAAPPARAAAPVAAPIAHAPAAAPAARPTPSPVARANGKAIKVTLDETPTSASRSVPLPTRTVTHAAPAPAPAPPPVAAKPAPPPGPKATDVHKDDNPLLAAVRGAVRARPPKSSVPPAE